MGWVFSWNVLQTFILCFVFFMISGCSFQVASNLRFVLAASCCILQPFCLKPLRAFNGDLEGCCFFVFMGSAASASLGIRKRKTKLALAWLKQREEARVTHDAVVPFQPKLSMIREASNRNREEDSEHSENSRSCEGLNDAELLGDT